VVVLEEVRPVRILQTTVSSATLDWDGVKINVEDLPSVVKMDGIYLDLVKRCQEEVYAEEIHHLRKGEWLPRNSYLLSLAPNLGEDGVI